MNYSIFYHPKVSDDVKQLDKVIRARVADAIQSKLLNDPYRFGKPLQYSLKGARTLRVGDYRVIYIIRNQEVMILAIVHRRRNYANIDNRIS